MVGPAEGNEGNCDGSLVEVTSQLVEQDGVKTVVSAASGTVPPWRLVMVKGSSGADGRGWTTAWRGSWRGDGEEGMRSGKTEEGKGKGERGEREKESEYEEKKKSGGDAE